MGGVLLGMPGPWAEDYREASDPYTTKVGGLPDWPLPVNADLLRCGACGSTLCLVAQVHAPTPTSQQRILFILGCLAPKCRTWRVLRVQNIADVDMSQQNHASATASSCEVRMDDDDDDDVGDMDFEELGRALFEAGTLASKTKGNKPRRRRRDKLPASPPYPRAKTVLDKDMPVLPCFYIYIQEEPSSGDLGSVCSNYSSLSIKENGSDVEEAEETWEKEHYEYDKALTADRTYLKFKKRLDAYQEQCFRYSYGGKPILAAADEINPGSCSFCGRPRQFEIQLMSPVLTFLLEATDDDQRQMLENWDWMTVIVYTCSESCCEEMEQANPNSKGWIVVEEAVVAQYEESMRIQPGYLSGSLALM